MERKRTIPFLLLERKDTVDSQQSKGNEKYESYLPCNGVCVPRRIQNLLALNKNKMSMLKTDHHKKGKTKKSVKKKERASGDGSFEITHTSRGDVDTHTHTWWTTNR